ncbi:MAG TPA: HIT family protein [Candidatus Paceibacterota bacterium]|nr:HIT family protein [Candidatus Paceibacterota bacterium]
MDNCIFCKIVRGEIPAQKVYEDEHFIAFLDINPRAPGHTLLIPKQHYQWFIELPDDLYIELFKETKKLALELKEKYAADYVQLGIVGKDVPHAHVHLIPRQLNDASVPAA